MQHVGLRQARFFPLPYTLSPTSLSSRPLVEVKRLSRIQQKRGSDAFRTIIASVVVVDNDLHRWITQGPSVSICMCSRGICRTTSTLSCAMHCALAHNILDTTNVAYSSCYSRSLQYQDLARLDGASPQSFL